MATAKHLLTLHRYFIYADRMRLDFLSTLKSFPRTEVMDHWLHYGPYMDFWYGGLHVVIEGWLELGLSDSVVDPLLASPNVSLLRRYRNGVFHFQRNYFDNRRTGLITDGEDEVEWIRALHTALGDYFLRNKRTTI